MSKNGHNFATALPIDVMFGSRVGLWGFWLAQIYSLGAFIHALLSRVSCVSWAFLFRRCYQHGGRVRGPLDRNLEDASSLPPRGYPHEEGNGRKKMKAGKGRDTEPCPGSHSQGRSQKFVLGDIKVFGGG